MTKSGVRVLLASAPMMLAVFAGCLEGTDVPSEDLLTGAEEALGQPLLALQGMECWEGGFVAAYNMDGERTFAGGAWVADDIREEIGNPNRNGLGTPIGPDQELTGNWHQGIKCSSVTYDGETHNDFILGYVGDVIKAPAWDPGGADLHFLVSAIGIQNGSAHDNFRMLTKAGISGAYDAVIDYYVGDATTPRSAAYVAFKTNENGIYESYSELAPYRMVEPRTVRIWWTVPTDGTQSPLGNHHIDQIPEDAKWNPVYFDLITEGGQQVTTPPVDSVEVGCHAGIDDHGPQGALCQPTLTNIYEHKSLEFKFGGTIKSVVLDEYWHH